MITIQVTRSPIGFDFGIIHRAIFPAFICYLAISGLSLIKAINLAEGLFEWLKLFLFTAFFYSAVLILFKNRSGITIIVRGVILTAAILSALGICQYYRLAFTSIPGNYIIYATLAHKNLFASALFLMLPFVMYGVYKFSSVWQLAGWVALVSMSFSIILAKARSVWVAILFATISVVIICVIKNRKLLTPDWKRRFNINRALSVSGFLILLIIAILLAHFNSDIVTVESPTGENKISTSQLAPFAEPVWSLSTLNERFFLWEKSLAMAKANPLLGVGLGQWRLTFPAYGKIQQFRESDEGQAEIFFRRPHNDYVWGL
jgi:putative inorganic carbon (HCO3(-)) transporter